MIVTRHELSHLSGKESAAGSGALRLSLAWREGAGESEGPEKLARKSTRNLSPICCCLHFRLCDFYRQQISTVVLHTLFSLVPVKPRTSMSNFLALQNPEFSCRSISFSIVYSQAEKRARRPVRYSLTLLANQFFSFNFVKQLHP